MTAPARARRPGPPATRPTLARAHRALAREWHPTRNGALTPRDVTAGSRRKAWWRCARNARHVWEAAVANRVNGRGCPLCANRRVSPTNVLATRFPRLAREWHPAKNGELTPRDVVAGSHRAVWWQCPAHAAHAYRAPVVSRTRAGTGCPTCGGRRVDRTNSLAARRPDLAAEWHPTLNGDLTPADVTWGSGRRVWWACAAGPDHAWQAVVTNRTGALARGCPFCRGLQVSVTNALASLRPDLAAQWHPTKNGPLRPDAVVAGARRTVWWRCPAGPDHEWPAAVYSRTLAGNGCPFCAGQRVSVTNALAAVRPDLAAEWHPTKNRPRTPATVVAGSGKPAWWRCRRDPRHVWRATPDKRLQEDTGCPFCANRRLDGRNSLAALRPDLAAEWHPTRNGTLRPRDVVPGARRAVWWRCASDPAHEWRAALDHRTARGSGCPECTLRPRSRVEIRLAFELAAVLPLDPDVRKVRVQVPTRRFARVSVADPAPLDRGPARRRAVHAATRAAVYDVDMLCEPLRLVVEYDGSYWHRDTLARDREKTARLEAAGYRVIRVREAPLPPVTAHDVSHPPPTTAADLKACADLVLRRVEAVCGVRLRGLGAYLRRRTPARAAEARAYETQLREGRAARPPRRRAGEVTRAPGGLDAD